MGLFDENTATLKLTFNLYGDGGLGLDHKQFIAAVPLRQLA